MPTVHDNGVEREMTPEEVVEYETTVSNAKAQEEALAQAKAAKEVARAAVLKKLKLTEEELSALLG